MFQNKLVSEEICVGGKGVVSPDPFDLSSFLSSSDSSSSSFKFSNGLVISFCHAGLNEEAIGSGESGLVSGGREGEEVRELGWVQTREVVASEKATRRAELSLSLSWSLKLYRVANMSSGGFFALRLDSR